MSTESKITEENWNNIFDEEKAKAPASNVDLYLIASKLDRMIKHLTMALMDASQPNEKVLNELSKVREITSEITPLLQNLVIRKEEEEKSE